MRNRPLLFCLAAAFLITAAAAAAPTELTGQAILDHAIGKLAVKHMGLVNAGKMEEAVALGSKKAQGEWKAMPADDKKMITGMMKEMSLTGPQFAADIKKFGKLSIDGDEATLTVVQETKDASGSSTSTLTQRYAREGGEWRVTM
jgi:hypothetical protein